MTQRLDALLAGLEAQVHGDAATSVSGVAYDSRRVASGQLFVALRGAQSDGHRFLDQAVDAGAAALLVEDIPAGPSPKVPVIVVPNSRAALAEVAARLFNHPARDLTLIGVTGTNGKTSTVRMIESILTGAGRRAGSIGTISVRYGGHEEKARLTTPESADLQQTLARMRDAGTDAVAMEVSSHSLEQERVRTLRFDVAVYTNLTQDHLDYHADMGAYADAKARLFGPDHLKGTAVLNAGDPLSDRLSKLAIDADRPVIRFARGKGSRAEIRTLDEEVGLLGSCFKVETPEGTGEVQLPLPGDFQIENALAALATGLALGLPLATATAGLECCAPIPGRLEPVSDVPPAVFVDYAHTPGALDSVLGRVRPLVTGRLICVFGCGGDRDRGKRAPMAQAACRHSDLVVATSDNPRAENAGAILRDVERGLSGDYEIVESRREAIKRAIVLARPEDVVVIAGKGHEDVQLVAGERLPFDDRDEARSALAARRG